MHASLEERAAADDLVRPPLAARAPGGVSSFVRRILLERSLYGSLAFAESAESLRLCRLALRPEPEDRVVGIASSGDVLLNLAAHGAGEVLGFDFNPLQIALAALKRELMRELSVQEYRRFLGVDADDPPSRAARWSQLARELGREHRQRLEADPRLIRDGALNRGMTYLIIRALVGLLHRLVDRDSMAILLGEHGTDQARRDALDSIVASRWSRGLLRPILESQAPRLKWLFFPHSICRVSTRPDEMIADFFGTFAPLFVRGARANPVLSRAAAGVLHPEWSDELYADDGFARVAANHRRIRFVTDALTAGLTRLPDGWATKVYLSNAPDYLTEPELAELGAEIRRVARPEARVLYFSLCDLDRLERHLGPTIEAEELERLRALDNVHLYPAIVVRTARGAT